MGFNSGFKGLMYCLFQQAYIFVITEFREGSRYDLLFVQFLSYCNEIIVFVQDTVDFVHTQTCDV